LEAADYRWRTIWNCNRVGIKEEETGSTKRSNAQDTSSNKDAAARTFFCMWNRSLLCSGVRRQNPTALQGWVTLLHRTCDSIEIITFWRRRCVIIAKVANSVCSCRPDHVVDVISCLSTGNRNLGSITCRSGRSFRPTFVPRHAQMNYLPRFVDEPGRPVPENRDLPEGYRSQRSIADCPRMPEVLLSAAAPPCGVVRAANRSSSLIAGRCGAGADGE
jgi:hypothetical protein